MYKIEIDYQTGNTFGSHDETREIEDVVFSDIESAKEALQIIAKHKEMNSACEGGWRNSKEEVEAAQAAIALEPWAVKSEFGMGYSFELKVPTYKDCPVFQWETIYCFWMGYFETLHEARIVSVEDDGMSVSFR